MECGGEWARVTEAAATEEGLLRWLKAGSGGGSVRGTAEEDAEASPSWSVLREAEWWSGGERDGEEGPQGGTEGRDIHELWKGDEQTCVFGVEEGLEEGTRFDMAGTATSEEPAMLMSNWWKCSSSGERESTQAVACTGGPPPPTCAASLRGDTDPPSTEGATGVSDPPPEPPDPTPTTAWPPPPPEPTDWPPLPLPPVAVFDIVMPNLTVCGPTFCGLTSTLIGVPGSTATPCPPVPTRVTRSFLGGTAGLLGGTGGAAVGLFRGTGGGGPPG